MKRRAALILLAIAMSGALAPPADAQTRIRTQSVAGWRIASGDSGDGGYAVWFSRRGRGYRLEQYLEFWRGNGGVATSATFRRGTCRSGDASAIVPFEQGLSRATFEMRLANYLREYPLPRAETVTLRRSLNAAWPRFFAAARRARAAMNAEIEAILRHGEQR
jgi:hypothetical protein